MCARSAGFLLRYRLLKPINNQRCILSITTTKRFCLSGTTALVRSRAASFRPAFLLNLLLVCLFWFSNIRSPEVGCVFGVGKVLVASHLLDALRAICVSNELSLDGSVLELARAAIQVPRVSNH